MTHALEELDIGVDRGRLHIERSPRWVRTFVDGQPIADSKQVLLVFEPRRLPVYYFPIADVRMDVLKPSDYSQSAGDASRMTRWSGSRRTLETARACRWPPTRSASGKWRWRATSR